MPRKARNYKSGVPYHFTTRSNNSEWFKVAPDAAWSVFTTFLNYSASIYKVDIHAFVLMANHFHLLCSFKECNQPLFLNRFLTETSVAFNDISGTRNHTFGGRNYMCEILTDAHYLIALKYILRNPVKAGVVTSVLDYKFSSLSISLGFTPGLIVQKPKLSFDDLSGPCLEKFLDWIDIPFEKEKALVVQRALKKSIFSTPLNRKTYAPIDFEDDLPRSL